MKCFGWVVCLGFVADTFGCDFGWLLSWGVGLVWDVFAF